MNAHPETSTADAVVPHLDEALMRDRLAHARLARLAFLDGDQPLVVPVNIWSDGVSAVVFRTTVDGLLGALDGEKVALEIDGHDPEARTGWSVLVVGAARDLTAASDPDSERWRAAPVDSWAPGVRARTYVVVPQSITGRIVPVGTDGGWFPGIPSS
jgi:nitroimidazol reductase NimA-like FMN-containing flavoprotein (pyridoxamine 5'-phosphate oxidase superfamily)